MDYENANPLLQQVLEQHGLTCSEQDTWLHTGEHQPPIRATWYPYPQNGVLDIEVFLGDGVKIVESFAGLGTGAAAMQDGMLNFCHNDLHVFLAAFYGLTDPTQVLVEDWPLHGKTYQTFIGNFGRRGNIQPPPAMPDDVFMHFEAAIAAEADLGRYAWFRFFVASHSGHMTFEALKNNDEWAAGLAALHKVTWPQPEGYYSMRGFVLLCQQTH